MSSSFEKAISDLAQTFAQGVLSALHSMPFHEILGHADKGVRSGRGAAKRGARASSAPAATSGIVAKAGRLERRSVEAIGDMVEKIVELLSSKGVGMRAEDIRRALRIEAKELARPLKEALSRKKISKAGQKRATTYFARGAKAASAPAEEAGKKKAGVRRGAKKTAKASATAAPKAKRAAKGAAKAPKKANAKAAKKPGKVGRPKKTAGRKKA